MGTAQTSCPYVRRENLVPKTCQGCGQSFRIRANEPAAKYRQRAYCERACFERACFAKTPLERLEDLVVPEPNSGCWLFVGGNGGRELYGRFWHEGRYEGAHRASLLIHGGVIPQGHHVDHLCFTPACCNPDHLEAVPPQVNCQRKPAQNNQYKSAASCVNGHKFEGSNLRICRTTGRRVCLTCQRLRNDAHYTKRRAKRSEIRCG